MPRVLRQRRISLRLRIPPSPLYFFALQKNSFECSAEVCDLSEDRGLINM